jgi:hypothetical protein
MVGDHRGARPGRNHDVLSAFQNPCRMPRHLTRLRAVSRVEGRLSAAGLALGKVDLETEPLEDISHGYSGPGEQLVDDAADEE